MYGPCSNAILICSRCHSFPYFTGHPCSTYPFSRSSAACPIAYVLGHISTYLPIVSLTCISSEISSTSMILLLHNTAISGDVAVILCVSTLSIDGGDYISSYMFVSSITLPTRPGWLLAGIMVVNCFTGYHLSVLEYTVEQYTNLC